MVWKWSNFQWRYASITDSSINSKCCHISAALVSAENFACWCKTHISKLPVHNTSCNLNTMKDHQFGTNYSGGGVPPSRTWNSSPILFVPSKSKHMFFSFVQLWGFLVCKISQDFNHIFHVNFLRFWATQSPEWDVRATVHVFSSDVATATIGLCACVQTKTHWPWDIAEVISGRKISLFSWCWWWRSQN